MGRKGPAMADARIAFTFCLAGLLLAGCAPMGSGRHGAEPTPADSIAIAYIPESLPEFADYRSYRDDYAVRTEISALDLSLRENDFSVEEVGPENFPALRRLGADSAFGPESLRGLRHGPNRLLVVLEVPVEGDGKISGKTMASDITHNVLAISNMIATIGYNGVYQPSMQHTTESGHGFQALLFDRAQGRILLDTVSAILTNGTRVPGQRREETPIEWHYRNFVKTCVKGR
jgi:hypothetical protein